MNIAKSNTVATGLAMFSMFFGAGNLVFPLALGQYAQNHNPYAILGLLITAVGVPFLGLIAMTLFDGDYKKFFEKIGSVPGFLVTAVIMGLLGPFGAIPRCVAFSYSTIKLYLPSISLPLFSFISCLIILAFTYKKNRIVDILGKILTPILLISLIIIIGKGMYSSPASPEIDHSDWKIFVHGLKEGYQTMDLIGAFFFSAVALACLRKDIDTTDSSNYKKLAVKSFKASAIGAFLLSIIYIGFSFVSAYHSEHLSGMPADELAGMIAMHVLGPYAGIVACLAVALACLTTAIALAVVFADFINQDITNGKVSYEVGLLITLGITFFVAIMNFTQIAAFLGPILQITYPALIMLTIMNILNKLWGVKVIKLPVLIVFVASIIAYFV